MKEDLLKHIQKQSDNAWLSFHDELKTDENADYRRGFKAGVLCALLQTKIDTMEKLENVD